MTYNLQIDCLGSALFLIRDHIKAHSVTNHAGSHIDTKDEANHVDANVCIMGMSD